MPRPKKPARLWQRYDSPEESGRKSDSFVWIILDEGRQISTGHRGRDGRSAAEKSLVRHLSEKHSDIPSRPLPVEEVSVDAVLDIYLKNLRNDMASPERQAYAVMALAPFWSRKLVSEISDAECRRYVASRSSPSTARRELGVLRAALKTAHRIGLISSTPIVYLPSESKPRPDWLSRDELAAYLRELRRVKKTRHAARRLIAQYMTGSRPRTIAETTWHRRSDGPWVDLDLGIWHRSGDGEGETNKRRRDHAIPRPLLAHLRRWRKCYAGTYIIEHPRHPGKPCVDIGNALDGAALRADLKRITPHVLKHTAITLGIQSGMSIEEAAEYFSTSVDTIERVYWHHSPHYQHRAVTVMSSPGRRRNVPQ